MRYSEILEACWTGYRQQGMKKKGDRQVPNCVPVSEQEMEEDLKKWFKEKWVRFGPDGKIRGDCARGSSKEGKPKCLPQSKAHALGKKGRASAAAKKRREDPNPERRGPARNVATKVKEQHDWDDADEFGMPGSEFFPDEDDRLRDGDYVRDRQDGEHGEIFRMSGDPSERRVRILDRDGKGWYISPERLVAVDRTDPDIMKYFGKRRHRDMDEGWKSQLAGAALAGSMAMGAGTAQARVTPGDDPSINRLTGQPNVTQAQQGNQAKPEAPAGFSKAYLQSVVDGSHPRPMINKEKAQELLNQMRESSQDLDKLDEKQDACYRKVKSRYKVWPSAYASGALVQCRKKGAANWGTGSKKK